MALRPSLALPSTPSFALIPDGYAGLVWTNFYYINKNYLPGTGYAAGPVSGTNAAYVGVGDAATVTEPNPATDFFDLNSVDLTAAFIPGLNVTVDGYNTNVSGSPLFTRTVSLSTTTPTLVNFGGMGDFTGINKLTLSSDPNPAGPEFAMDNLTFTPTDVGSGQSRGRCCWRLWGSADFWSSPAAAALRVVTKPCGLCSGIRQFPYLWCLGNPNSTRIRLLIAQSHRSRYEQAAIGWLHDSSAQPGQEFWRFRGGQRYLLQCRGRRDLRLSRAQRRRQDDHDSRC